MMANNWPCASHRKTISLIPRAVDSSHIFAGSFTTDLLVPRGDVLYTHVEGCKGNFSTDLLIIRLATMK
jgi:hypothetical protein